MFARHTARGMDAAARIAWLSAHAARSCSIRAWRSARPRQAFCSASSAAGNSVAARACAVGYAEMAEGKPESGSGAQERSGLERGLRVRIGLLSGNRPERDRTSANSNGPTGKRDSVRLGLSGKRALVRIRLSVQRCRLCRGVCVGRNDNQSMAGRSGRRADVTDHRSYLHAVSPAATVGKGRTCLRCDLVRLQQRTGAIGVRCRMARLGVGGACVASHP